MMSQIGQPLDVIGVVLVARMYHIHVAIIQEDFFWTTRCDHDIAQCKVLLGWQGSLQFIDIKRKVNQLVPVYKSGMLNMAKQMYLYPHLLHSVHLDHN